MRIVNTATVRGGHCSIGSVWESHVENTSGFRSIDFVWGVERKDVYKDPKPAGTGDAVRVTVEDSDEEVPLKMGWFGKAPVRRIARYEVIVRGGWPTTYGKHGFLTLRDYWYVTFAPILPFTTGIVYPRGGELRFDAQLGTTHMPFKPSDRVWITVDLMVERTPRYEESIHESYNYSR